MSILKQLRKIEKLSSSVLGKTPTQVFLLNTDSKVIAGGFMPEENVILINSMYTELTPTVVGFIAHESRHAYQNEIIAGKLKPKASDQLEQWQSDFKAQWMPTEENMSDYAFQTMEIDAIAYSELFLTRFFNKKLKIKVPETLRVHVDARKNQIEYDLNFDILNGFDHQKFMPIPPNKK